MRPPMIGTATRDAGRNAGGTNTMNLSYVDMNIGPDGSVMTRDQIRDERLRQGYCTDCRGTPIRLYTIKKSRYNPLWSSKQPCTQENQSLDGQCLMCKPELDPNRRTKRRATRHQGTASRRQTMVEPSSAATNAHAAHTNGGRAAGRGGRGRGQAGVQSMMDLNTYASPRTRPLASSLTSDSEAPMSASSLPLPQISSPPTNRALNRTNTTPTTASPNISSPHSAAPSPSSRRSIIDDPASPPSQPRRSSPPTVVPTVDAHLVDNNIMQANVSIPDLGADMNTNNNSSRSGTADAVVVDINRHNNNNDSTPSDMIRRQSTDELADDGEEDATDEPLEVMYARCRRMSSMRNLRQNSMINLVAPPPDTSPILNNLIRNANQSPPQRNNSRGMQPSTRNLTTANTSSSNSSRRNLDVHNNGENNDNISSNSMNGTANAENNHRASSSGENLAPSRRETNQTGNSTSNEANVVMELGSLIKDLSSQGNGNTDFTTDILVGAMKDYPNSVAVQMFCLGTIWDLCKDSDQYKSSIISTSAPDDILLSMKAHLDNAEIQERACGALWSLSVNQHNRVIVIRAGAPARIVKSIVDHQRDENVIRTAVGCLRTLSPESEVRESMGALQGIKHVCEAMKAHRTIACIQRDGCAFLSNSAVDLDKQQVAMASNYEFEAIVMAMESHRSDASVMAGACFALKNYTYEERNVRGLCAVDGMVHLLENAAQYCDDANCQRDASIVLERIQNCREEDSILEEQVVSSLLDSVKDFNSGPIAMKIVLESLQDYEWSATVSAGVFQCLVSLARLDCIRQIDASILSDVMERMAKMIGSAAVQINGCELLAIMATSEPKFRSLIIERGVCKTLVDASRKHLKVVDVQVAVTAVLKVLSPEFECWFELQKSSGDPVAELLAAHTNSQTVQQNGSEILANFSAYAS